VILGYNLTTDFYENRMGGVNWTDLAQDRDKWRESVKAVMNLLVP
jgi:hypothetical protein